MLCEQYKNALIEAAASGAAPSGELRVHLAACACCRVAFDEEQSLFAGIDSGLHAVANAEVPPSLVPCVRTQLDEAVSPRFRWVQSLVFASAGVALVFTAFLLTWPRHTTPENLAKQDSTPSLTATAKKESPEYVSPESAQTTAKRMSHPLSPRKSTNLRIVSSSNPEVLVPPDEREAFARLVAVLNEHSDVAASLLAKAPQKDAVVTADPLQIPDIEIKPLEGTETSDGGEKR